MSGKYRDTKTNFNRIVKIGILTPAEIAKCARVLLS